MWLRAKAFRFPPTRCHCLPQIPSFCDVPDGRSLPYLPPHRNDAPLTGGNRLTDEGYSDLCSSPCNITPASCDFRPQRSLLLFCFCVFSVVMSTDPQLTFCVTGMEIPSSKKSQVAWEKLQPRKGVLYLVSPSTSALHCSCGRMLFSTQRVRTRAHTWLVTQVP